jgi:hypothetical protein
MKSPVVLFRDNLAEQSEREACARHLPTFRSRVELPDRSLVVGRYSVLPYYRELEYDLMAKGCRLLNSHREHLYIADVMQWGGEHGDLAGMTPRSWDGSWAHLPEGAYVVKGKTNSRKHSWATHMFAPTKAHLGDVVRRLMDDTFIRDQGVVIREYVPLKEIGEPGIGGLPVTNEWRTFWLALDSQRPVCLAHGFYWSSHPEALSAASLPDNVLQGMAFDAAQKIAEHASFFVLDLAETVSGEWIVVEVNDGQMSGLSEIDPDVLYRNLAQELSRGRI